MTEHDHLEGKRISERYRIKTVRKWTEHTVFCLAEDLSTGSLYNLILLDANSIKDENLFKKELAQKAKLRHKNLISIVGTGISSDGDHFIVLENPGSKSMSSLLEGKALPVKEAVDIAMQVLEAQIYLSRMAEPFTNILPQQILLTEDCGKLQAKSTLLEFSGKSLAADLLHENPAGPLTKARYSAPESIKGSPLEARSQIYTIACLLYQMLSSRAPFESDDLVELESQHLCVAAKRIHEVRPDLYIDPRLEAVILKALNKEPAQRQASLLQFKTELKEAISEHPLLLKFGRNAAVFALLGMIAFACFNLSGFFGASPVNPIDNPDLVNLNPANPAQVPSELAEIIPALPEGATALGAIHLSGNDRKELSAGNYLCKSISLKAGARLHSKGEVQIWVIPDDTAQSALSLADQSEIAALDLPENFKIYDCGNAEIKMSGKSKIKANVLAPAALLDAKDEACIEGKFTSNGQKLSDRARFLNSESSE